MLEVSVLDIIQAEEYDTPLVLLRHETRVLPILVGQAEAHAIHFGLAKKNILRPMTHDLLCNIFAGLNVILASVTIYQLQNDTFYAYLSLEQKNAQGQTEQVLRIDSRPSDGIALAVRVGCPILVSEEVMDAAGKEATIIGMVQEGDEDDSEEQDEEGDTFNK